MKKLFTLTPAPTFAPKVAAWLTFLAWADSAFAHDGHGLGGSHWHATDVLGFAALGGMVALAVWLSRDGE